jgi:ribosomal protein L19E
MSLEEILRKYPEGCGVRTIFKDKDEYFERMKNEYEKKIRELRNELERVKEKKQFYKSLYTDSNII